MAIGTGTALVLGGAALAGGIAGSQGKKQTQTRQLGAETDFEKQGGKAALDQLKQLQMLIGSPEQDKSDIDAARSSQQDFIKRLQQLAQSGGLPSAQDMEFGQQMVAPQRVAMNQALQQQQIEQQRMAGQMGRSGSDPIMMAKLAQLRQQGEERLGAQAGQYALGNVDRTLNFQGQATQLQSGLASQALANRQALLSAGSQLWGQGANFRTGNASITTSTPGGFAGAVSGAIGGASAGMSLFNAFGGGGGTNKPNPSVPTATNTGGFGNYILPAP
jgi:hypothetical protein